MSRSSTNKVKRCPNTMTTNCIEWLGEDIPCLSVCYGDTLTDVENAIALKLCELVGDVDMSKVTIPDCLLTAWNNLNEDKTIFYLFDFILDQYCIQQSEITALQSSLATNDPIFNLNYCSDCLNNPCNTKVDITVSEHLQNILNCLCELNDKVKTLEGQLGDLTLNPYSTVLQAITDLKTRVDANENNISSWVAKKSCILLATNC